MLDFFSMAKKNRCFGVFNIPKLIWLSGLVLTMPSVTAIELTDEIKASLGPKACASCHKESTRAWKKTQHYKTYKEIPRKRVAKQRAKKMRFKQIKTDSLCVNCHFTAVQSGSRIKTVAGISCESCHGGSKEWLEMHSDFGGRGVKVNEETPEHNVERHVQAESKGMFLLSNLYGLAKSCYRCHTVPEEKLVNIGRHPAGSDFELVQWGQGEVRHNLWYTENSNNSLSQQRLRKMFVVGKALDLEYALRGLVLATSDGEYFQQMVKRKSNALADLKRIESLVYIAEILTIINIVEALDFRVNNSNYLTVAEQVGGLNKIFSIYGNGDVLTKLDSLLPNPESYKGVVYEP